IVILFLVAFFRPLLTMAFDEEMARADNLPVDLLYYGLLTAVSVTLVVSVKVVGIVLGSALVVIPAAIGYELSLNFRGMLAISLISGVASSLGGLILSYLYDMPSGATIVLCATALFLVSVALSPRRPLGRRVWRGLAVA